MNPLIPAIIGGVLGAAQDAPPSAPPVEQHVRRALPEGATKAVMEPPEKGNARFDGQQLHLAPGLQIRDTANRIVRPSHVRAAVPVRYVVDHRGDVSVVWILTPAEAGQP